MQAQVQKGIAAAESIFNVLDTDAEQDSGSYSVDRVEGYIEFRDVSFGYKEGGRPVLRNVSFSVPAGSVTALVGHSGSGKTTLAGLLPRFYTGYEGHILLDGHELSDYCLDNLRSHISLVSQNVVLFNDTVAANIAYGALAGSAKDAIVRAASDAHAMGNSSVSCPPGWTPWSVRMARFSPAVSASAWPSPGRCSRMRPS